MAQLAGYWINGHGFTIPLGGFTHLQYTKHYRTTFQKMFADGFTRVAVFDDIMMIESSGGLLPRRAINTILSDFTIYVVRAFLAGQLREIVRMKPIRTLPKF